MVGEFLEQILEVQQQENVWEVIVVNDGSIEWSVDESSIQKKYQDCFSVRFIHHQKNFGKGAAVRSGIEASQGTHALMLDVDCATAPESVLEIIRESQKNPQSVICGSRYMKGGSIEKPQKKWRQQAGSLGACVVRLLFKISHQDTQCGAKIFPGSFGEEIVSETVSNRWAADVEWLVLAQKKGFTVKSVPVMWSDGKTSQVKPWHFVATAWDVLMIRLRS